MSKLVRKSNRHCLTRRTTTFCMIAFGFAGTSLLISGCGMSAVNNDSDVAANEYYQALVEKNWTKAESMCAPEFFRDGTKEEWQKMMIALEKKFGKYQSRKKTGFQFRTYLGANGYTNALVTFQVQYEKGVATEILTLRRQNNETEMKVFAHQINSKMLLQPDK